MKFSVFQVSRKGGREKNEDRMGYCYTRGSGLFLLADGMGGHPEGEVAAKLALQTMSAMYQKAAVPLVEDVKGFLEDAALAAHRQILRYALDRDMADTPRTTIVAALLQDGHATWAHCGDSRLYLARDGDLIARTRDHSYQEQRHPTASAMRAALQSNRNILFTCLGSPTKPLIDIEGPVPLVQGDRMLLCSDGLWGNLEDEEILSLLSSKPVSVCAPDLVEAALQKGGPGCDNVTVIALEWETPGGVEFTRADISTEDIDDGVFASTMQGDHVGADTDNLDELDDEAIERSIAEINDAIRRSAARRK
jgi:PPM family protein phosphatase